MSYSVDPRLLRLTDPKFKHMLGKKVQFKYKGQINCGILSYAGVNTMLHNKFQVTIERTPYWPVDPNSLVLLDKP